MIATYRLQLTPDFGFAEVRALIPYLSDLGVSHLYLSPISEAAPGSSHGYDVSDHNRVRGEFGGREGFEELRRAVAEAGMALLLDVVPNHAGVGSDNPSWQDVLAYGPASPNAAIFDIDWQPLKPELRGKVLLPFLGRPYGEALDEGEIALGFDQGYFHAAYFDSRFRLSPATYAEILGALLPDLERQDSYFDIKDLAAAYEETGPLERDKAEALKVRLEAAAAAVDLSPALARFRGPRLHALLERQFWRLAYWKTAGDEINYRRFFDVNGLVALRMEEPAVFFEAHRLLAELLLEDGVDGVRIDHVDGLFDPQGYLDSLRALGAKRIWVEKILAPGETLPEDWPACGTTGYEFMNDALRLLVYPGGERELLSAYDRLLDGYVAWPDEVYRSKRLVMETSLAGELTRLAHDLYRLSESDYHTRDFTLTALRDALADIIASFERYRTYLPHGQEVAQEVIGRAVSDAKRRAENAETSVHDFIRRCLLEPLPATLEPARRAFVGRFQQYTAPVAAKGVEDTAFYRYVPLAALNEVGGEPEQFAVEAQAFHSRARFRQHRYPLNLLASATHDHKRGEDTRMRLASLSELGSEWLEAVAALDERAQRYWRETTPLGAPRISQRDSYLFYQHLLALWEGEDPPRLAERLAQYMQKAMREAKQRTSWINPDEAYETAAVEFVRAMTTDREVAAIVAPLAAQLARYGFLNSLSQLALKLTTPGVPDFYQGAELLDLSLVDPDNRRPVDFERRRALLDEARRGFGAPELAAMRDAQDERLKLYMAASLLRFRREHEALFAGAYRPVEAEGEQSRHLIGFLRESDEEQLLVLIPRFLAVLERSGGWQGEVTLPEGVRGGWRELLSGATLDLGGGLRPQDLPFLPAVLHRQLEKGAEATRDSERGQA